MTMNDANHARRGILTTVSSQAMKFLIQTLATVLLARILMPDDFGAFAMVVAITGFANLVGDFGLSTAAIQAKVLTAQQRTNLFWLSFGVGVALWGAVTLAAGPVESFYGHDGLSDVVKVVAFNFLIAGCGAQFTANLTRELKFGWLAVSDVTAQSVALITAVSIALVGGGVWALVAQQLVITFAALVVSGIACKWLPGLPRRAPMRRLLSFGAASFGVQALTYASSNVDSIVLGKMTGPVQLGLYDQAYRLFKVPVQQIAAPMTRVALPILSRAQGDLSRFGRILMGAQAAMTLVLGSVFVIAAALSEPAVITLIGDKWQESVPLFAILAIGGVFQSMGYIYYWTFLALGLSHLQLRWSLLTRSVMVLAIVLAAFWGPLGVAIAVASSLAFNWVILTAFPLRKTGLAAKPIVLAALRALTLHLVVGSSVFICDQLWASELLNYASRLAVGGTLALVLYVIMYFVVPGLRSDLGPVIRIVRSKGKSV